MDLVDRKSIRQRQVHHDRMHVRIRIQRIDRLVQLIGTDRFRKFMKPVVDAQKRARTLLTCRVHTARGISRDDDGIEPDRHALFGQHRDPIREIRPDGIRQGPTIDDSSSICSMHV